MRGEYGLTKQTCQVLLGSSPLARGIQNHDWINHFGTGIIPACAGNTRSLCTTFRHCKDHPRLRGEYPSLVPCDPCFPGSSPLARGIPYPAYSFFVITGIIPACAGNTWDETVITSYKWDHPRLRGEYQNALYRCHANQGSSPLARGIH